jgi:hypothetical protein
MMKSLGVINYELRITNYELRPSNFYLITLHSLLELRTDART